MTETGEQFGGDTGAVSEEKSFCVVKLIIHSEKHGLHGGGVAVIDLVGPVLKRMALGVGPDKKLRELTGDKDWHILEDTIITEKMNGHMAIKISQDLTGELQKCLNSPDEGFMKKVSEMKVEEITALLEETVRKSIDDTAASVRVGVEFLSETEFQRPVEEDDDKTSDSRTSAEVIEDVYSSGKKTTRNPNDIFINVKFILSPVRGVPVKKLQQGTRILVVPNDPSDKAKYLAGLLSKEAGQDGKLSATVEEVDASDPDSVSVTCRFGPGIYGVCRTSPDIMVKVLDENEVVQETEKQGEEEEVTINPVFIVAGIIFLILVLVLIITR